MKLYGLVLIIPLSFCLSALPVEAQTSFETVKTFPAEEAHQAVAVDSNHFYAIASRSIGKYDKETGKKVDEWKEKENGPILLLYLAGHDRDELYSIKLPKAGSILDLVEIIPVENEGQGIAWDRSDQGFIYTIKRSSREMIISKK